MIRKIASAAFILPLAITITLDIGGTPLAVERWLHFQQMAFGMAGYILVALVMLGFVDITIPKGWSNLRPPHDAR